MRANINSIFPNFWQALPQEEGLAAGKFVPTVETFEKGGEVRVTAELPGMTEDDVHVTLSPDGDYLTLSGEKKFEKEENDEENNYYHFERSYGSFQRHVPLPCTVDKEKVKAKFKNGVLKVTMKKLAAAPEARHIKIEV